ncbi:tetratricopeptide repeat protein [Streptomyces adustus]
MADEDRRRDAGDGGGDHVDFRDGFFAGPVVGTSVQHHHYPAPRPRASWPHQVGVIPPRASCFQDRAEARRLHETLTEGETAVLVGQDRVRGRILTGMGGVGKTQLAADHARRALQAGELDVLLWITAADTAAVVTGYVQAAMELLGADPANPEMAAKALLAWLEPKAGAVPCRWLVVLDDVADPADLSGLWPPDNPHGRTVVTTRRQDAALTGRGHLIKVGLFTRAEALAYLGAVLANCGRHEPEDQLSILAEELGHLPLALSQAAAYVVDAGVGVAEYRTLLADRTATLADAAPDVLPDGQAHSTAAAWSLSVDHADTLRPTGLARPLLHLAVLLDANGIPQDVLTSGPTLAHLTRHRARHHPVGGAVPVSAEEAVRGLRALHRLSLVDYSPASADHVVRVHQLIQRAVQDTFGVGQRQRLARSAADALMAAWPKGRQADALTRALRANAVALMASAQQALHTPDLHPVLFRAGDSLGESGQALGAADHYRRLLDAATHVMGDDHPSTLAVRHSLARWQGDAGDVSGAASATAELLRDRLRVLGPDHPDTLTTRHNLAHWRGMSGDAAGAASAFDELLKDRSRVLGPDHHRTFTTRSALAHWQAESGDLADAVLAVAELLGDCLRVLGPDHPQTLTIRNSLARWRGEAGDIAGAAHATADLLRDRLRILGPDHPHTLSTRSGLARWQGEAGDVTGALTATSDVLTDCLRVLGPRHPLTVITRAHLARWQGEAGDPVGAVIRLSEVLRDSLDVLGPDHKHTHFIRSSLSHWESRQ